jgi:hypothetical protein
MDGGNVHSQVQVLLSRIHHVKESVVAAFQSLFKRKKEISKNGSTSLRTIAVVIGWDEDGVFHSSMLMLNGDDDMI